MVACRCFSIEPPWALRKTAADIIVMTIIMTMMIMIIMLIIMMISIGPVTAPRLFGRQQQVQDEWEVTSVSSDAGEEHEEVCEPDNG